MYMPRGYVPYQQSLEYSLGHRDHRCRLPNDPGPGQERFSTVFQEEVDEWFDIYSLTDPSKREELQVEGLRDSINFIQDIIKAEAKLVDPKRLILPGLSQGCATGVLTLLGSQGKIGAFIGCIGRMPFAAHIEDLIEKRGPRKAYCKTWPTSSREHSMYTL